MNELSQFIGSDETGHIGVCHLKRFWSQSLDAHSGKLVTKATNDWRFDNMVLNGLGLGLENTLQYLYRHTPSFDEFEGWILAINGGHISKLQIDRINCVVLNQLYSRELQNALHQIEESEDVLTREDLEFWEENGYVVVREAVSCRQAQAAEKAVWESLNMNPEHPASWYEKPIGKGTMMDFYHHPALLENRQSPRLRKAFTQIWKTADLWVTTDRTGFNPPETDHYSFQGFRMHWDVSLEPPFHFGTQGLLYLCDTPAEQVEGRS